MRYGLPNRLQWEILFYATGVGFLLGILYAGLMLLRAVVRHWAAVTAVEDVSFCVVSVFLSFIFLLDYNGGTVRIYLLLAEAVGFFAVRSAAAKIIVKMRKNACKKESQ